LVPPRRPILISEIDIAVTRPGGIQTLQALGEALGHLRDLVSLT